MIISNKIRFYVQTNQNKTKSQQQPPPPSVPPQSVAFDLHTTMSRYGCYFHLLLAKGAGAVRWFWKEGGGWRDVVERKENTGATTMKENKTSSRSLFRRGHPEAALHTQESKREKRNQFYGFYLP